MKWLKDACLVLSIVAGMMSIVLLVTHNVPDAIYCLLWAVWMAVLRGIRE
ncbi:MAG TPA: hypothetical protein VFC58_09355 [Desulfosporosinus sp.]|nr:hypothetical protein [Desulfosporosinus sp.]